MQPIGRVTELWHYPVSSVAGEALQTLEVTATGVPGDRLFALFEVATGHVAAPERDQRWRPALFLEARRGDGILPELRLPGEDWLRLDDPGLGDKLGAHFGFEVAVGTCRGGKEGELRFPIVSNRYAAAPLHILTTASLEALSARGDLGTLDARRFRPSVVIETEATDTFLEAGWVGHPIRIGETIVEIREPTRRCGMTLAAQPGIPEQPEVLRTIMRHASRNFGVYGAVGDEVTLSVGDLVYAEI